MDAEEIEGVRSYVLGLCSAIGGLEEVIEADETVGQVYCPGDDALGEEGLHYCTTKQTCSRTPFI